MTLSVHKTLTSATSTSGAESAVWSWQPLNSSVWSWQPVESSVWSWQPID